MPVQVIDLFCGVGGLTRGLLNERLEVVAGYDIDRTCQYAYEHNNGVNFHIQNVRNVTGDDLNQHYNENAVKILVGCAPCQPFSQMRSKLGEANLQDEKYELLSEYGRLIDEVRPSIISMENVPRIRNTNVYKEFLKLLRDIGYYISEHVVYCPDYGISQTRRRFVLLGSLISEISLIEPTHIRGEICVRDCIEGLPELRAGERDVNDLMHRSANLSNLNIERIQNSRPGGTWADWPEELRCACHRKKSGESYKSVYGRMSWDQIGPTITTQFYNYGTGRFGHPVQDRALSLREGALLQTFPLNYDFINPEIRFVFSDIARHIGNAVPVRLGEVIGLSIIEHLEQNNIEL
ncbi:DNA cytosine methyltransferase [Amedibacillus sp. YH-ame6]